MGLEFKYNELVSIYNYEITNRGLKRSSIPKSTQATAEIIISNIPLKLIYTNKIYKLIKNKINKIIPEKPMQVIRSRSRRRRHRSRPRSRSNSLNRNQPPIQDVRHSENINNISTDFLPKSMIDESGSLRMIKTFDNKRESQKQKPKVGLNKKSNSKTIPSSRFYEGRIPSPDTFQFY